MRTRGVVRALATVALLLAAPVALEAQSLFGSRGLGVTTTPVDGRSAALGGLGIALPGPSAALLNPADAAEVTRRGVIVAMQPSSTEIETASGTAGVDATRFPLVQLHLPVGSRTVLSAGYGAYLDQNWGVTSRSSEPLGEDTVTAVDRIVSSGGIAQGRFGVAYGITETLTLGASIGVLTGSTSRVARRTFEDDDVGLSPFQTERSSAYNAPLAGIGVRWRPGSALRVGAALTWTGDLSIDVENGTDSETSMPLQAVAGASVHLLDDLLVALSGRWTGWSSADGLPDGPAEDAMEIGGGIEYTGIQTARRVFPVRLGARYGAQPFSFGGESPTESALSFGLGARLAGSEETPMALVDLAIERGARGDLGENGLSESFWRATVSVSLFAQ